GGVRRPALAVCQVALSPRWRLPLCRRGGSRRERREAADDLRAVAGGIGEEEQAVAEGVDEGLVDRGAGLAERLSHRLELVPVDGERQAVGIGERRGAGGEDLEPAARAVAEDGEL